MSDENDKERTARAAGRGPQASQSAGSEEGRHAPGPAPNAPTRGPAARTMLGLSPPQDLGAVRAGLSGHAPGRDQEHDAAHARTDVHPAPAHDPSSYIADKLYMEPPSEVFARAQTQAASKAPPPPSPPLAASNVLGDTLHSADMRGHREPHAPGQAPRFVDDALEAASHRERPAAHAAPRFVDDALRAAEPRDKQAPRFTEEAAQTVHEHSQQRAPAPALRTSFGSTQAPEAWRNDVKRMAQRGATSVSGRPGPTASAPGPGSLRLKLDATADDEDHYRGVPKSRIGAVLVWLLILGGIGAGAAYWFDSEGGVNAVVARVQAALQGKSTQPTPPLTPATPAVTEPAAQSAAPGAGAQPPSAAAAPQPPSAASSQPSAANAPEAKPSHPQTEPIAQDKQARELADPSSAEPPKAEEPKPSANDKPKPAAPEKAEKPKPAATPKVAARPVAPRHEPIIKVKPMGSAGPAPSSGAPDPLDVPYVPAVPDPPAPSDSP